MVIAINLDVGDLPEFPLVKEPLLGLDQMRRAAALRADLHDAVVFPRRGKHRLALDDVHADRLLAIHIDAGLARLNHRQRMPMVRRRDLDDVEPTLLDHLTIVMK